MTATQVLLTFIVAAPLVTFLVLGGSWLAGWQPGEKFVARVTGVVYLAASAAVAGITVGMQSENWNPVILEIGPWFRAGGYVFPLNLLADSLSLPLLGLTVVLAGLIGSFSSRYLHRDRGYFRFFLLLHLFAFGATLAFAAGSLDLLIGGWELVGFTSIMLIAFFNERRDPVRNAMRTFAVYRITDVGLLLGVFILHHVAGSASWNVLFRGTWPEEAALLTPATASAVALLFLLAALGKSAQVPFSGWLPRAMEGPTPSSAIFYGGISVHLGVYLLLRSQPFFRVSPVAPALVIIMGLITAIHATLSGRAATDAKTSLAYATLAQLGVIFIEVGLGFERLALYHVVGHAAVRTLQFLRAPSMLHDYHRVHAAAGGQLPKTGTQYESLLPMGLRQWLYRLAIDRCHLDTLIDRFVAAPVMRCAQRIAAMERAEEAPRPRLGKQLPVELAVPDAAGGLDV